MAMIDLVKEVGAIMDAMPAAERISKVQALCEGDAHSVAFMREFFPAYYAEAFPVAATVRAKRRKRRAS